jgi:hypothetical protein
MKFSEFKRTCVGRTCKIVKSEQFCPEKNHPIYAEGWNDSSAQHKALNIPRKINQIRTKSIVFEIDGRLSYADIASSKEFQSTEKGFVLDNVGEKWGIRLTYEWC